MTVLGIIHLSKKVGKQRKWGRSALMAWIAHLEGELDGRR
jgi:hypothetical protein